MWPVTFEERLQEWNNLRRQLGSLSLEQQLPIVNDWWFRAPMINQHLRWDSHRTWPGPWDLLAEDRWCDVARALGIVYTIMMVPANSKYSISMTCCDIGNLVLVEQGKYILNWAPQTILNIDSTNIQILRQVDSSELQRQLGL